MHFGGILTILVAEVLSLPDRRDRLGRIEAHARDGEAAQDCCPTGEGDPFRVGLRHGAKSELVLVRLPVTARKLAAEGQWVRPFT